MDAVAGQKAKARSIPAKRIYIGEFLIKRLIGKIFVKLDPTSNQPTLIIPTRIRIGPRNSDIDPCKVLLRNGIDLNP